MEKKKDVVIELTRTPDYREIENVSWGEILKLAWGKSKKHLKYVIPSALGLGGLTWLLLRKGEDANMDEDKEVKLLSQSADEDEVI